MPLTSFQKNFIKKNAKTLSSGQIAADLGIAEKAIRKFSVKHGLKLSLESEKNKPTAVIGNFDFNRFFAENLYVFVFLFFLVLVCYFNSVNNGFVSDDIAGIAKNESLKNFGNVFNSFFGIIQRLLYFLINSTFGPNPIAYRLLNILVHLLSVFSAYTVLSILAKKNVAVIAAALFAVHPILIESVSWISGFPYAFYSLFLLLAFLFYIIPSRGRYPWLSLLFFFLALDASEKAVIFFIILFFYELGYGSLRKNWKRLIPYTVLGFVTALVLLGKIGARTTALQTIHYQTAGVENPLIQIPISIINYLRLIFWPQNLTLYHTDLSINWTQYYFVLFLFLACLALAAVIYRKNKPAFFWLSLFIVVLLPTLTPLQIAWVVAERYVYLGALGIFVAVAMLLGWLADRGEKWKPFVYGIVAVIILSLSVRTILRNVDWKNEDNLWFATARVSDVGANIHNNLGDVYSRQGNLEKAAEEFQKAFLINPRYADAVHNLGLTYAQMGKTDEAVQTFKKAIELNPNIWQSYQQLAVIYYNQGQYDLALENIKKALEINPSDEILKQNLEIIQKKINDVASAKNP